MEPRPATRYKENVPPKTVTVLGPELKSPWKNLDISLGSGGGRRRPICQATTYSQGSVLCQKPYQVQSNLASPRPCLALALKDTTGQPGDTGLWQQSNLQLPAGRSQGRTRESFAQQSNLCFQRTASPHLQKNRLSPAGPSSHQRQTHQVTGTPCLDSRLSGGLKPLDGCTWPNPSPCCGPGSWAPRLVGQPLTLEDLSVSAHSQSWAHFRSACSTDHRLLDSIHHLEPEATCSRSQTSQEHPGPTQRGPPTGGSQSTPAQPWPSHPRESVSLLETLGVQAGLSESPLYKPLSHEAIPTLGTLAGDFSDPNKEVLSTEHLGVRERGSPGLPYNQRNRGHFRVTREAGSREARPESPTFFSVLPGQEGREKAPPEKAGRDGKKMASCPSNGAPAQNTPQNKAQSIGSSDPQAACQKLLSRSFRAWRHLSQRRQAAAKAIALSHRQLVQKSLRVLRWVLQLQEARLEAAWDQHADTLLAWSFQKLLQQKQEQPFTQAASPFLASRGSPSLGRKVATDLAWKCRCFRAWQRFAQRGAQCRRHAAHRRVRVLRTCLGRWMELRQLQVSDVAKVTQLALYRRKAGNKDLNILVPGTATAHCLETVVQAQELPKEPNRCSLWDACQKLALQRALLLWRTRLYQHQQAASFFQGLQKRALQYILRLWHLRVWGPDPPSSSMETMLALEPWGDRPGGETWLDCRRSGGSLEKVRIQQTQGAVRLYWRTLQRRYFQTWCERLRHTEVSQDQPQVFQDDLRKDLGATLAGSQEACRAAPPAQAPRCVAQASVLGWRSFLQQRGANRQLRKAQTQQAFVVWVLEVWIRLAAQAHVQRADITQCWQRLQYLLRTHWVQGQSTLLKQGLEPQTQAQGMDFRHWLRLASRGHLLHLMDTPNFLIQTHSCWTPVLRNVLPSLAWQHGRGTQRTPSCALSDRERPLCPTFQFWLPLPAWAQLPTGLGELCSSETRALQGQGEAPQRNRYLQCWQFQASQQARCLARAWQRWVDVHWLEQLSRTLLRQWHLDQAWRTWRKKVLQLQVARRLHQQEDIWVLSQAFEKWYQRLVARSPQEEPTARVPWKQLTAAQM
ncbi:uncharacterized protein C1orf167 homolog isoform X3 [Peromyscus maniculatus bairdii]